MTGGAERGAMVGKATSSSESAKRSTSPSTSTSKIASWTSTELEPRRSRMGMFLTLRERLA